MLMKNECTYDLNTVKKKKIIIPFKTNRINYPCGRGLRIPSWLPYACRKR